MCYQREHHRTRFLSRVRKFQFSAKSSVLRSIVFYEILFLSKFIFYEALYFAKLVFYKVLYLAESIFYEVPYPAELVFYKVLCPVALPSGVRFFMRYGKVRRLLGRPIFREILANSGPCQGSDNFLTLQKRRVLSRSLVIC